MLRIHQIPLPPDAAEYFDEAMLRTLAAKALRVPLASVKTATLQKRSVDARDKSDIHFTLTADVCLVNGEQAERSIAGKFRANQVAFLSSREGPAACDLFHLPLAPWKKGRQRPIVVGAGPAGLFCALALALRGAESILLERGQGVEMRERDVSAFEESARLDPESNVLFGEGGAGAFSDGKLTCGLNHPHIRTVLGTLCACGAPQDILTAQRPHIGTDELRKVLLRIREKLTASGCRILFGHKLTGLTLREGRVVAAQVWQNGQTDELATDAVYLAIGHSARDTYEWLHALGMPMQPKPFAIGARIEHLQSDIGRAQYGDLWQHPALPAAEYKLNIPTPDGRGVYTFCMCPGGQVIGAMNEQGTLNVNGMSLHARDGANANAALLVGITPADFGSDHPLAGVFFQRSIEQAAYAVSGSFEAPCQRVGDLLDGKGTRAFGRISPSYRPGVRPGDISAVLPAFVTQNFRYALPKLGQRLRGFDDPDALLTAPETRSSAPVRLLRSRRRESALGGLYPLGEGAGYAGGIVSAAVDGLCAGMESE